MPKLIRVGEWVRRAFGHEDEQDTAEPVVERSTSHPLVPEVQVELDKVRTLRLTMRELYAFQKASGLSVFKGGVSLLDMNEEQFLDFLVCMASSEDPNVTRDDLAPALYGERITDAVAAASILFHEFMPPVPEGGDNPLVAAAVSRLTNKGTGPSQSRP